MAHIAPFNNDLYISLKHTTCGLTRTSGLSYDLCLMRYDGNITHKIKLDKTIGVGGLFVYNIANLNKIVYIHFRYEEDQASLIVEFFNISVDNIIIYDKSHIIPLNTIICNETIIKICKLDNDKFVVIWDAPGYDYYYMCEFSYSSYNLKTFQNDMFDYCTFEDVFFLSDTNIIRSKVIGHDFDKITICIENFSDESNASVINNLDVINHKQSIPIEFKSDIQQVYIFELEQYFLIRTIINTPHVPNALPSKWYIVDILVKVKFNKLEIIEISQFDNKYSVTPSIVINKNKKLKIFNMKYLEKNV
jgi:hypothetical protein